jgi:hypothetical protein
MTKWWLMLAGCTVLMGQAWAGDPTQPPAGERSAVAVQAGALTLQGVIWGRRPLAIVNGVTLHAGDRWRNLRVIRIERNRVLLDVDGQRRWLSVNAMRIRRNQR